MQALDDMELLRAYATRDSEAAFETLVARHVHWVYSAALRQVRDPQAAEEVAQAVFTILARKASSLKTGTIVGGWLFNAVRLTAAAELRTAARRRRREREAQMEPAIQAQAESHCEWEQIAPLLDEALAHLSQADRNAVLLRYFEQKNLAEVGAALGASEEAARKRVSRAVEKLRAFFVRHGSVMPAGAVIGLLSTQAVRAAPAGLAPALAAAAAIKGTAAAGSTATLVKATLELMAWTKLKLAALVGAGVLLAAGTAIVTFSSHWTPDPLSGRVERILREKMLRGNSQWRAGMDELWALGPDIIPHLASKARRKDPVLSQAYAWLWKNTPAALRRRWPRPVDLAEVRQAAMHAIAEFGPLAVRRSAPQVIDGLTETDDRFSDYAVQNASWLLPEYASTLLPILEAGLAGTNASWPAPLAFMGVLDSPNNGGDRPIPGRGTSFWASFGPRISEALPLLTNLLGNAGVAYNAAIVLGNIGPDAAPAIPALIQTADLGAAGSFPDAEAARIYLEEVYFKPYGRPRAKVRQNDKGMNHNRAMAALALGRIGIATPEVCAALARAWNAPDGWVRHNAALAVRRLGLAMTNNLPELLHGLLDPDQGALDTKLAAIGKLGPAARDGLGTLRELTQTKRVQSLVTNLEPKMTDSLIEHLAVSAKIAICRIDPQEGRPLLPAIANQIGHRWEPVEFLAEPGPLSNDVVRTVEPLLERTENTPQSIARQSIAAYVILRHDRTHPKALDVLRRNESVGKLKDRLLAGGWLFESLGETNSLCSLIAEAFRAPESFIGQDAGQIAGEMGTAALPAVPAFKAALWHRDQFVREYAGRLILKLAPQELPIRRRGGTN